MEKIKQVMEGKIKAFDKLRGKINGFTMIANRFIESNDFSIYEKMVVIVIKKHQMNKKEAWPSHDKIALQSGCSISSVKKAILKLMKKNILVKDSSRNKRRNIYKVTLDKF